nr:hypothetical protein [uncultured Desulfobulbus sp.]
MLSTPDNVNFVGHAAAQCETVPGFLNDGRPPGCFCTTVTASLICNPMLNNRSLSCAPLRTMMMRTVSPS